MKILCIIAQNIDNVKNGGAQCAKRNYDTICKINGSDNTFICIISEGLNWRKNSKRLEIPGLHGRCDSALAALCGCKTYKKKYEKDIIQFINEIQPELIYIDTSKLGHIVKYAKKNLKCKVVVFMHNVESDYSKNQIKHMGAFYILSYLASFYNESICMKKADKIICLTKRDATRVYDIYGRKTDAVIPISFHDRYKEKNVNFMEEKILLFIGSLFPPNYNGIKWFVENVMDRLPDIQLTIVGKGFEKVKEELERNNVNVVGTVDNLDDYYYRYPVMVMPIHYGDGMKVKTAEALMFAKIIIGTHESFEGYDIQKCKGIYECNTDDEFISAIKEVFSKPKYINMEARNLFLRQYEFGATEEAFRSVLL